MTWAFQRQKEPLPLSIEQGFKTMQEQVKAKGQSAMVVFVYHPIPKNRTDHQGHCLGYWMVYLALGRYPASCHLLIIATICPMPQALPPIIHSCLQALPSFMYHPEMMPQWGFSGATPPQTPATKPMLQQVEQLMLQWEFSGAVRECP